MQSLLPLGHMLAEGQTREWRGQATPRFLASLEGAASPSFGNGREEGRKGFGVAEPEALVREQGALGWV